MDMIYTLLVLRVYRLSGDHHWLHCYGFQSRRGHVLWEQLYLPPKLRAFSYCRISMGLYFPICDVIEMSFHPFCELHLSRARQRGQRLGAFIMLSLCDLKIFDLLILQGH